MFSGIVEETARVSRIKRGEGDCRLVVHSLLDLTDTKVGDSIAIDGACLTVVAKEGPELHFDASSETLRRTTLGKLQSGSPVNLERALRLGDRLNGHLVTGHVDTTVRLLSQREEGGSVRLNWSLPPEYRGLVAEKGSVALGGISLTVGAVAESEFSVYIIPHTLKVTTLGGLRPGDPINFEVDLLARYVQSWLAAGSAAKGTGVTWDFLAKHGFGG